MTKQEQEQIEEMAIDLEEEFVLCGILSNCGTNRCSRCFSKYLYKQGYRKESDTAREILDEVSKYYGGAWLVELYEKYGLEVG